MRAILVSDVHLQARAPVARSPEPDWFEAMARPLREIQDLACEHQVPVLYAGDIFDRWNSSPEVINFALEHLPPGYAVPGQHDLPNHSYDEIERSAYWTLVQAGHLTNLPPGESIGISGPWMSSTVFVRGFPWGYSPEPETEISVKQIIRMALVHRFIYTKETGYPGAPTDGRVSAFRKNLAGYDVAVFGDNHKGFIKCPRGGPVIVNCGGLMRRKVDERDYRPQVVLLYGDGSVGQYHLDTTQDEFIELTAAEEAVEKLLDMTEFVASLRGLGANDALDFLAAVKRFLNDNDIPNRVRDIILEASGGGV